MTGHTEFTTAYQKHAELLKQTNALNKAAVFDALQAAGISSVTVTFDGEGDSGQTQDVTAYADKEIPVPSVSISFYLARWGATEPKATQCPLEEAIRDLCWDYLSDEHGGWENNDGGYGEFTFNAALREVELDFYSRYTDSTHYNHTF